MFLFGGCGLMGCYLVAVTGSAIWFGVFGWCCTALIVCGGLFGVLLCGLVDCLC